jgi:hypothetical protein
MKKMLAFVSLLVLAVACAAPPTNITLDSNRNANLATERSSGPPMSEAAAIEKEKAIWDTIKNKDYEAFGNMLADDQTEVVGDGVYDKAATITAVREFEPSEVILSDWKYLPIDRDSFVLIYTAKTKGKYKGKEFPPASVRASSAWVNRDGKWLAKYHQECDIKPAPAPAAPTPAAKTAASPAPMSPLALGSDPIANEKAVWEAIKSKNYEGFASALAPEAIEVEPTGVYDKEGSVKGVSQADLSKAEISDFKAASFDADAALVTYIVKVSPDPPERHTTIWSRRDGKWLAIFHHGGTPVTKPSATAAPKASASPAMK